MIHNCTEKAFGVGINAMFMRHGKWTVGNLCLYLVCCFCTAQEDYNAINSGKWTVENHLYFVVFALHRKITMQLIVENGQWRTISTLFVVFAPHRKTTMQLIVENGQWRTISTLLFLHCTGRLQCNSWWEVDSGKPSSLP